jgi:hypothetical protein
VEDDYKILDFVNQHAPGDLMPWRGFDHPQLGKVELGGWHSFTTWRNPPPALLEAEIAPQADFAIAFASLAPRIAWREVALTPLGDGVYHLLAVIENRGFLSTSGSNQAASKPCAWCAGLLRQARRSRAVQSRRSATRRPLNKLTSPTTASAHRHAPGRRR